MRTRECLWWGLLVSTCLLGCGAQEPAPAKRVAGKQKSKVATHAATTETIQPKEASHEITADASSTPDKSTTARETEPVVQKIYRADDRRRPINPARIEAAGLQVVTGKHLVVISDLPVEEFRDYVPLVDQLCPVLDDYFGPLLPNRAGTPYQMTGCLMEVPQRFIDVKLMPDNFKPSHEGWYYQDEFWLNRQPSRDYTRHLLLHEATHCYMLVVCPETLPPWYVEGMAELFATLRTGQPPEFGSLPRTPEELNGWGRIGLIQNEVRAGRGRTLDEVLTLTYDDYLKVESYAWSWALCHWLEHHPRFQDDFHKLARTLRTGGFRTVFAEQISPHMDQLRIEWIWFTAQLQYGHDLRYCAPAQADLVELKSGTAHRLQVSARSGWQSTGIQIQAGQKYHLQASGRVVLGESTRPWISEPDGITLRYANGLPIGRLVGIVAPEAPAAADAKWEFPLQNFGRQASWTAEKPGVLFLRINDDWSQIDENRDAYEVELKAE